VLNVLSQFAKLFTRLVGLILCVIGVQATYFLWIVHSAPTLTKADLIVVLPGEPERMVEAQALAAAGLADHLLLINENELALSSSQQESLRPQFGYLVADSKSRSTFEDIFVARQAIGKHSFRSVILVTSAYHLPRALFLLKTYFLAKSMRVNLQYYPVATPKEAGLARKIRVYGNEMIKFWGSGVEMLACMMTDTLLRDSPYFLALGTTVKARFLFEE
jgi:uncharacterized SAM-binding protein YcdF (DUF218 family)